MIILRISNWQYKASQEEVSGHPVNYRGIKEEMHAEKQNAD